MEVNQVLKLGSLQISVSLLMIAIGLLLSILVVEILAKRKGRVDQERWSDFALTHLLVFLIVYKFGWIIFDLKNVINNPSLIFWMSNASLTMATIVTLVVFLYKIRKSNYSLIEILDNLYITLTIMLLTYSLFIIDYGKATESIMGIYVDSSSDYKYHPINWYRSAWLVLLIFLRYKLSLSLRIIKLIELYILLGIGLLLISIFDVHPILVYGFSLEQWVYIIITLIGSIGIIKYSSKKD